MRLVIEQGEQAGLEFRLARPSILIGRTQEADITLAEQGVSRQHARLEQGPEGWVVTDLGTTNGTCVNGRQIPPNKPIPIQPGDRLSIGSSVLALQASSRPEPSSSQPPRQPLIAVAGAILFVLALAAVITLLVILLQPGETTVPTPTQGNPIEQLITAVPLPTEMQEVVPSVIPLIPTEFRLFPGAPTETPPPLTDRTQGDDLPLRTNAGGEVGP
jgi:pSer/pThr/pTyr-binding forkhead associated (FHA) protein